MYKHGFSKILIYSNFRWIQLPLNLVIFSTLVSQKFGVITKMTITSSGYRWGHQLMNKKWIIFNCKVYDVCMCSYFRLKFKWLTIHLAMIQQFLMFIFLQKLMTLLLLVSKLNVLSRLTDLLWKVFQWSFKKIYFFSLTKNKCYQRCYQTSWKNNKRTWKHCNWCKSNRIFGYFV